VTGTGGRQGRQALDEYSYSRELRWNVPLLAHERRKTGCESATCREIYLLARGRSERRREKSGKYKSIMREGKRGTRDVR